MTCKERIKAAMDLEQVDQIPFMCQMSIGHMLVQLDVSPLEFWFDLNTYIQGITKLREQYEFDGVLVSLYGHNPNWQDNIVRKYKTNDYEIAEFKNGNKIFCPFNELPFYQYLEKKKFPTLDKISVKNLPSELNYFPVSQNLHYLLDPDHKFDALKVLVSGIGKEFSIHGEITSPFDYYLDFFDHQSALIGLIENSNAAKVVLGHFTELLLDLAEEMCETGIDAIKLSSPFAGSGFISPEQYMEFVFPYEKKLVQKIRSKNVHAYIHTCGAINDRLENILNTGASGIECLDPKPLGDVDLSDALTRVGSRGFIKGNIDSINLLLHSSYDEIISEVREIINIGSKNNGFILSTACSIAPSVKKENIQLIKNIIVE